jgi:fused signal recognition particle receptor
MIGIFKQGLSKTLEAIKSVAPKPQEKISKELLEEVLLEADVDYELVEEILYYLPPQKMVNRADVRRVLGAYFIYETKEVTTQNPPFVELVLGVNGAGKTTTIAKLAYSYKEAGKSVILGASDTFRAAAVEQLKRWSEKIDVPIVATKQGHDPSAVAFDTISSAKAKKIDNVIIDTAGRLQNQTNLVNELKKITRICNKAHEGAPHRKILVIDGTQGNSAIAQAKAFHELVGIDGIIITKLDGTAKGGALFGIAKALELPILYVGVGESEKDLISFDAKAYVEDLLDAIFVSDEDKDG